MTPEIFLLGYIGAMLTMCHIELKMIRREIKKGKV